MIIVAALLTVIIEPLSGYYGQTYQSRETFLSDCLGQMIYVPQGSYSVVCVCVGDGERESKPCSVCVCCICVCAMQ